MLSLICHIYKNPYFKTARALPHTSNIFYAIHGLFYFLHQNVMFYCGSQGLLVQNKTELGKLLCYHCHDIWCNYPQGINL